MSELDPQVRAIVDGVKASGAPEYCDQSPAEARASHNARASVLGAPHVELHDVRDMEIPGLAGNIPVRLYRPSARVDACLIFYHGGGHVVGSLDSYDTLCRQLADQSGIAVASVDYRLAPEHRFPAAVDDAFSAWEWFTNHADELGFAAPRLQLGGDSAGGNLAAVTAILARDRGMLCAAHQLLVYPATAAYPDTPSHFEFDTDHILTRRLILWFHEHYLRYEDHFDSRWAPILNEDLEGLPPATVILAECDPLRDEGIDYASRLARAGNDTTLRVYPGMTHPFFSWSGKVDAARAAVSFAAAQMRDYAR